MDRVVMDTAAAVALVDAYLRSARVLDTAADRLSRSGTEVARLTGDRRTSALAAELADIATTLRTDAADLEWRRDLLARVDALTGGDTHVVEGALPSRSALRSPAAIADLLDRAARSTTAELAAALVDAARSAATGGFAAAAFVTGYGLAPLGAVAAELVRRISGGDPDTVAAAVTGLVALASLLGAAHRTGGRAATEIHDALVPPADGSPWADRSMWLLALTVGAGNPGIGLTVAAADAVLAAPYTPALHTGPFALHHTTQEVHPAVAALQRPGPTILATLAASGALTWAALTANVPLGDSDVVPVESRRAAARHLAASWDSEFGPAVSNDHVAEAVSEIVRDPVALETLVSSRLADVYDTITRDVADGRLGGGAIEEQLARDFGRIAAGLDLAPGPMPPLGALVANGLADAASLIVPYAGSAPGANHYGLAIDALRIPDATAPPSYRSQLHADLEETLFPGGAIVDSVRETTDVQVAITNAILAGDPDLAASLEPGPWVSGGRFTPPPPGASVEDRVSFSLAYYDAIGGTTAHEDLGDVHWTFTDRISEGIERALGGD